jgi:hypothetical protein
LNLRYDVRIEDFYTHYVVQVSHYVHVCTYIGTYLIGKIVEHKEEKRWQNISRHQR